MRRNVFFAAIVVACGAGLARAEFARVDVEKVPVERVVANLEELVKKEPKDINFHYNLARVHGMAYARKVDELDMPKGQPGKGAWFGYEPAFVPFAKLLTKTEDEARLKAAKEHLTRAIAAYKATLAIQPDYLPAQLGLAWSIEQTGDKEAAIAAYRKTIEAGWAKDKTAKAIALGGHYITREAAGYLMPLLDKEKDKEEIATLNERLAFIAKLPRVITPLVVPLEDGLSLADLVDAKARVRFDADGTGKKAWSWITPKAAWLVMDRSGKGRVDSGLQLFGSVTFWTFWDHGYQALALLDDNGDGEIAGKELDGLALWHDANGNGVCEPGEVRPLSYYGIVALSCRGQRFTGSSDCSYFSPVGVRFATGATRPTFDVLLQSR